MSSTLYRWCATVRRAIRDATRVPWEDMRRTHGAALRATLIENVQIHANTIAHEWLEHAKAAADTLLCAHLTRKRI